MGYIKKNQKRVVKFFPRWENEFERWEIKFLGKLIFLFFQKVVRTGTYFFLQKPCSTIYWCNLVQRLWTPCYLTPVIGNLLIGSKRVCQPARLPRVTYLSFFILLLHFLLYTVYMSCGWVWFVNDRGFSPIKLIDLIHILFQHFWEWHNILLYILTKSAIDSIFPTKGCKSNSWFSSQWDILKILCQKTCSFFSIPIHQQRYKTSY